MDSLCVIFAPALEKYTTQLLARIAVDYNIPSYELVNKYMTRPAEIINLKPPKAPKDPNAPPKAPRKPKDPNAPPKAPKVPLEDRPICPSLTGKKTPCKNKCLPGSDKCHLHSAVLPTGEPKPPKPPKVPKAKKVKEQPTHSHAPLVAPDAPCQLCDTHGDAMNPGLTNVEFESSQGGMSLQERLRMIIQMGDELQDDLEPEVESPGSIRHRMLLAEKGQVPQFDEDPEDDEMTEDEFEEEELLE
jgi:hypothetical protein